MIEGRAGEFDARVALQGAITGNDLPDQFADEYKQCLAVRIGVQAALFHQTLHQFVGAPHTLTHPGKVVPHQQIRQITVRQVLLQFRLLIGQRSQGFVQAMVGRKGLDHLGKIAAVTGTEDELALFVRQVLHRGPGQQCQQGIAHRPGLELVAVILQLLYQRGHEVDHAGHVRVLFEVPGHVRVILDGMEVSPWQLEPAIKAVTVIRLMHVPAQHQAEFSGSAHRVRWDIGFG